MIFSLSTTNIFHFALRLSTNQLDKPTWYFLILHSRMKVTCNSFAELFIVNIHTLAELEKKSSRGEEREKSSLVLPSENWSHMSSWDNCFRFMTCTIHTYHINTLLAWNFIHHSHKTVRAHILTSLWSEYEKKIAASVVAFTVEKQWASVSKEKYENSENASLYSFCDLRVHACLRS